jgi:hypothetical protein
LLFFEVCAGNTRRRRLKRVENPADPYKASIRFFGLFS